MSRFPFGCGWMRIREVICWLSTRSVVMFVVRLPFMLDTLSFWHIKVHTTYFSPLSSLSSLLLHRFSPSPSPSLSLPLALS